LILNPLIETSGYKIDVVVRCSDLKVNKSTEIDRRWQEVLDGTATLVSGEELSKKLTEKFGVEIKLP
jgi:hypothetical protein